METISLKLKGKWVNEYESVLEITEIDEKLNTFKGEYSSTTGETGSYNVTGCFNPFHSTTPTIGQITLTVSFSVSWNKIGSTKPENDWDCSVSSMTGQLQKIGEKLLITVVHVLVSPTTPADNWKSSYIDKLTFVKQ
jgi:hypothetical protein